MSIRRRRTPSRISCAALTAGATVVGILALSGCGDEDSGGSEGKLDVIASFYPMEFLAERIGGQHVSVDTLTGPGVEPHDLDLSPRQTAQVVDADLVVYLEGFQPAVDEAVAQSGVEHVVEASSLTTLEAHGEEHEHGEEHAEEHSGEGDGHADEHAEEHAEEHSDEGGEHEGHDHGGDGLDPHIWLDPLKYAEVAEGVGAALAEADPDHAADYERNTAELTAELTALDEEYTEGLADVQGGVFITTHAAFGYLAERYGLHEEAITGLDPESEPSAARMRELQDIAEADGVTTVFFETLVSDETARTFAGDLGLETAVLDPVEGITEDSPGADYFEVMRANLQALRQALGAQ